MSGAVVNFDANNVEPAKAIEPVPSGWYHVKMTDSESKPAKSGGNNAYLELEFEILDGPYSGQKLWDRINLWNANPTTVEIAYRQLSALQRAVGVMQCANTQELHNRPLKAKVKLRGAETGADGKSYDATNEIKGYDSINSAHAVDTTPRGAAGGAGPAPAWAGGPAPVATPAPVAAGAPPWAQAQAPQAAVPAPAATPAAPFAGAAPAQPWAQPQAAPVPVAPAPVAAPVAPQQVMTAAANGVSYEQYIAAGWTDALLVQHGYMLAPAPAAPAPVAAPPVAAPPSVAAAPVAAAPVAAAPPVAGAPPWAR